MTSKPRAVKSRFCFIFRHSRLAARFVVHISVSFFSFLLDRKLLCLLKAYVYIISPTAHHQNRRPGDFPKPQYRLQEIDPAYPKLVHINDKNEINSKQQERRREQKEDVYSLIEFPSKKKRKEKSSFLFQPSSHSAA